MKFPIPDDALDDRLAFVGIAGSGKTYNAGTAIERILKMKRRVVIVDPLDVWWGLRLDRGGQTPAFDLPIFGGAHGDLPLNEHAGKIIGETVATMSQSCIVSLGSLNTKASERRFMLAFLESIYRNAIGEPFHLVFDEADLWAPQKSTEPMLQSKMEEIVRRGRVKGFIPWLITQRPAVLSKDVLSQADGLVAFKLTSSHDRNAIGAWVEGQADKDQWTRIWSNMPTLARGTGMVWLPARGILATETFPLKTTYDSSRTPKRGEKKTAAAPKPLDLGKLRERLAAVEETAKANDPATLKAANATLRKEVDRLNACLKQATIGSASTADVEKARARGQVEGFDTGYATAYKSSLAIIAKILDTAKTIPNLLNDSARELLESLAAPSGKPGPRPEPVKVASATVPRQIVTALARGAANQDAASTSGLPTPEQKIVDAIRYWNEFGIPIPNHNQVAYIAGYKPATGTWTRYLSSLRSAGMIEPRGGLVLTDAGFKASRRPEGETTGDALRASVLAKLDGPLVRIMKPLIEVYPGNLSHAAAAEASGYKPATGTWTRYLSSLRSLDLIEPRGDLKAREWLFP